MNLHHRLPEEPLVQGGRRRRMIVSRVPLLIYILKMQFVFVWRRGKGLNQVLLYAAKVMV